MRLRGAIPGVDQSGNDEAVSDVIGLGRGGCDWHLLLLEKERNSTERYVIDYADPRVKLARMHTYFLAKSTHCDSPRSQRQHKQIIALADKRLAAGAQLSREMVACERSRDAARALARRKLLQAGLRPYRRTRARAAVYIVRALHEALPLLPSSVAARTKRGKAASSSTIRNPNSSARHQ
jgi:hypothetical protein